MLETNELTYAPVMPRDERGAALIIVLMMLLLLTILGATLLTSSTTDMQIAGNFRATEEAFYTADAAIEYAQVGNLPSGENIYTKIIPGVQNTYTSSTLAVGAKSARVVVQYVGNGPPPAGSGNDDTFQSNFYVIEATGTSGNNARVETESEIARLVPKAASY